MSASRPASSDRRRNARPCRFQLSLGSPNTGLMIAIRCRTALRRWGCPAGVDERAVHRRLDELGSLADILGGVRLDARAARGYDYAMDAPRNRRIWHFEAEPLCDALNEAGAWQTAVRIRVAHENALGHRPEGTAFDIRPTPEDVAPLNLALDALRAERARASRQS
jgi:hypothetical protein